MTSLLLNGFSLVKNLNAKYVKNDGNVEGRMYVVRKNSQENVKASNKYGIFTLIGLTSASGDTFMCVIITSRHEFSYDERMGVDIRSSFDKAAGFWANLGPGKTHPYLPTYIFRSK